MRWRSAWTQLRDAAKGLTRDDVLMLSAALAYYTSLSLAPLVLLLLWLASFLGESTTDRLVSEAVDVVGPQAGEAVRTVIANAESEPSLGSIAGIVGLVTLAFGASGVFAQLQKALNHVWNVKPRPGRKGIVRWLRKRLLSFGMILAFGFLLLVSLALSTGLAMLGDTVAGSLPGSQYLWQALNMAISFGVVTLLFAAMFKFLPDARIELRDVWIGAAVTALLFSLGKIAIGFYLGRSSVGSAYGAAGSLIVLLVWVYYSATIFFFGAELTQVHARAHHRVEPEEHAVWEDGHREPQRAS